MHVTFELYLQLLTVLHKKRSTFLLSLFTHNISTLVLTSSDLGLVLVF